MVKGCTVQFSFARRKFLRKSKKKSKTKGGEDVGELEDMEKSDDDDEEEEEEIMRPLQQRQVEFCSISRQSPSVVLLSLILVE